MRLKVREDPAAASGNRPIGTVGPAEARGPNFPPLRLQACVCGHYGGTIGL